MRFAYIDSHGNEVPIPSVDALALRIELGAIGPDTELYDAQADIWGPARTHEIFHTLSRSAEEEGFVAPPPPVAPAPPAPPAAEPEAPPEPDPEPVVAEAEEEANDGLGLTLAEPPPSAEGEQSADAESPDLDLDLAPAPEEPGAAEESPSLLMEDEPAPAEEVDEVPGQEGGFDFGDMSGGLEIESTAMDLATPDPGGLGGGMEVEQAMEFASPTEEVGGGAELELEQPMSEFQPDAPPGWMEAGDSEPEDVMDFSSVAAGAPAEEAPAEGGASAAKRRKSKDKPSPPKFKRQRSLSGPIILVVLLLAVGVGGYVAWPIVSARLSRPDESVRPPVVMPSIPQELLPQMRSLAEAAMGAALEEVGRQTADPAAPSQPGEEWLGGAYLGNASQFEPIAAFWESMDAFIQGVRSGEWQLYHDKYVEQAEAAGLEAGVAAQLVERADSGFVAAEAARLEAYASMERVVDAALDLHDFLVTNEESIEYRPAATSTADPVLEAVTNTPALADEMRGKLGAVTGALGDLGATFPFTRERLRASLLDRLTAVGIE